MSKYIQTFRLVFFTLLLYIWVAETVEFPGEKKGELKKDYVLREFNTFVDAKFPDTPLVNFIQSWVSSALSKLIDYLVMKLAKEGSFEKLKGELAAFFP